MRIICNIWYFSIFIGDNLFNLMNKSVATIFRTMFMVFFLSFCLTTEWNLFLKLIWVWDFIMRQIINMRARMSLKLSWFIERRFILNETLVLLQLKEKMDHKCSIYILVTFCTHRNQLSISINNNINSYRNIHMHVYCVAHPQKSFLVRVIFAASEHRLTFIQIKRDNIKYRYAARKICWTEMELGN